MSQLFNETYKKTSLLNFLLIILSCVLLITLCNIYSLRSNYGDLIVVSKWNKLLKNIKKHNIIFLGDSSGDFGISPKIIKDNYGLTSYNYCTVGSQNIIGDVLMLNQYLKNNTIPQKIILVHVYDVFNRRNINDTFINLPTNVLHGCYFKENNTLPFDKKITFSANYYLNILKNGKSMKKRLFKGNLLTLKGFLQDEYGFQSELNNKNYVNLVEGDINFHKKKIDRDTKLISKDNLKALDALKELKDKYNLDLYITISPLVNDLYADHRFKKRIEGIYDILEEKYKIKPLRKIYTTDKTKFVNTVDHLVKEEAKEYTLHIMSQLI